MAKKGAGRKKPPRPVAVVLADVIGQALCRFEEGAVHLRLDGDPRVVRRTRVTTRRLRSDLRTFGDPFDRAWVARVRGELRWFGAALGDVRDADVVTFRLGSHVRRADPTDRPAFDELVGHLVEERQEALDHLRRVLGSDRYRRLLDDLRAAATTGPPPVRRRRPGPARDPARREVRRAVRRAWRSLRGDVARLGPAPTNEDLHQVRIRTKRLRYALQATGTPFGASRSDRADARLLRAATGLQDDLGQLSDADQAEWWFRSVWDSGTPAAAYAAGRCAAAEHTAQADARARWPARWREVRRAARRCSW